MHIVAYLLAAAVLAAAGHILFFRVKEFFRTGGQSACKNCPFAGECSGGDCPSCAERNAPNKGRSAEISSEGGSSERALSDEGSSKRSPSDANEPPFQ